MEKLHIQVKNYILYDRRMSIKKAASLMPISRVHLSNYVNGRLEFLGRKAAVAISDFSNDKFKASKLMGL